jgi:hypothetical protein
LKLYVFIKKRFITFIFCAGTFCSCILCHMMGNIPIHTERNREGGGCLPPL